MRRTDVYRLLNEHPLRPFRIHVSDGSIYDIRHPEFVAVGRSTIRITLPAASNADTESEQFVDVARLHITRLEPILS